MAKSARAHASAKHIPQEVGCINADFVFIIVGAGLASARLGLAIDFVGVMKLKLQHLAVL
jgi:hypothetical protein